MIAAKDSRDMYVSGFAQLEKELPGHGQGWLDRIRQDAIHRFAELGFPTTHNEEWKYTNVGPIARIPFRPSVGTPGPAAALGGEGSLPERRAGGRRPPLQLFAGMECSRLVFLDGAYCAELSSPGQLSRGVRACHLAGALAATQNKNGSATLEEHLARYASFKNHPFVALNTAFMQDGALLEIPKDVVLDKPILLLFISTAGAHCDAPRTILNPRNLILAGRGSQASIIEGYIGLDGAPPFGATGAGLKPGAAGEQSRLYFTNAVTEILAGEGAVIDYCKVQEESPDSFHIATVQVHQARSSSVSTCSVALGGGLVREEINTVLDGEGAECLLNGLYVISDEQHVDNHTSIDHAKPHCGSRELYKGVLDGKSTGVFNGKIIVRKDAQKTDSKQSNKNLLLSEDAVINTKPQLEIYADDVKCTHGATIGQVDQEAAFYLRSRGIGLEQARSLLIQAFANDIIARIKFEPLRAMLNQALLARLGGSQEPESRAR